MVYQIHCTPLVTIHNHQDEEGEEFDDNESENEDEDDSECICGSCKFGKDPSIAKRCCGEDPCRKEKASGM